MPEADGPSRTRVKNRGGSAFAPSRADAGRTYRFDMKPIAVALLVLGCATGPAGGDPRARFLADVDAALASRDAARLEALADWTGWGGARGELLLPAAPIRRERELSDTEVLYRDAAGRSWRLVTRSVDGALRLVPRARPCPARGMERVRGAGPPAAERRTWTPLECWPLPK
jgi:hypothetical protein